ncbi:MAG: carbamate kinase [Coriobacteriia bacterium]|nr:carbamate kinase [Coriobacteriia bacterium]
MTDMPEAPRTLVIALGGNAILRRNDDGTITTQFERADASMRHITALAAAGDRLVLTHGNGPVVGNIMLRNEAARDLVPPMPLYIAVADSEGGIGLMLQMSLHNQLRLTHVTRPVVSVITQCVVDADDPAFGSPAKPIGPYFDAESAARLTAAEGWTFAEEGGRGWRRVVASPRPRRIVEAETIGRMAGEGDIVIAAGGGGVPVLEHKDGTLEGVDAVIDKDWASALLACEIGAEILIILMEEAQVYTGYGTPQQRALERLTITEADELLAGDELAKGSIRPKIEACAHFARTCGRDAIICAVGSLEDALAGRAGTRIVP